MNCNRQIAVLISFGALLLAGCDLFKKPPMNEGPIRRPAIADAAPQPNIEAVEETLPDIEARTYFAAGRLFETQGVLHKAMQQYHRALERDPDHVPALNRLGVLYARAGRHKEAERCMKRAVEVEPGSSFLRNNLGYEYILQRRWRDAEAELRNALQLKPNFERAHINLGMTLAKLNRFDEALDEFRAVLPEPDAYYNLGLMYRGKRRYQDAADAFHMALEINPQFVAAETQLRQIQPRVSLLDATEPTLSDRELAVLNAGDDDDTAFAIDNDDLTATSEPPLDAALADATDDSAVLVDADAADAEPCADEDEIAEPRSSGATETQLAAVDDAEPSIADVDETPADDDGNQMPETVNDARIIAMHAADANQNEANGEHDSEPTAAELEALAALEVPDVGMSLDVSHDPQAMLELASAQSFEISMPIAASIEIEDDEFSPLAEADETALAAAETSNADTADTAALAESTESAEVIETPKTAAEDSSRALVLRPAEPLVGPPLSAIAMFVEPKVEFGPPTSAAGGQVASAPVALAEAPSLSQPIFDNRAPAAWLPATDRASKFWSVSELLDTSPRQLADRGTVVLPYLDGPLGDQVQFDLADLLKQPTGKTGSTDQVASAAPSNSDDTTGADAIPANEAMNAPTTPDTSPDERPVAFMTVDAPAEMPAAPASHPMPTKSSIEDSAFASAAPTGRLPEVSPDAQAGSTEHAAGADSQPDTFTEWLTEAITAYDPGAASNTQTTADNPAEAADDQLVMADDPTPRLAGPEYGAVHVTARRTGIDDPNDRQGTDNDEIDARTHWHLITHRLGEMWCSGSCSLIEFAEAMDLSNVTHQEAAIYADRPEPPCLGGPLDDLATALPDAMAASTGTPQVPAQ